MYSILLYAHIMSAILSIGPFFVLVPLIKRIGAAQGEVLQAHIATFKSATRLVKHAGHALVASGALLIWQSAWQWSASWVIMTLTVMFASIFFLARAFTPVLRKFEEPEADQAALVKKLNRSLWIYIFLLLLMLWFMVDKPVLW